MQVEPHEAFHFDSLAQLMPHNPEYISGHAVFSCFLCLVSPLVFRSGVSVHLFFGEGQKAAMGTE